MIFQYSTCSLFMQKRGAVLPRYFVLLAGLAQQLLLQEGPRFTGPGEFRSRLIGSIGMNFVRA